MRIKPSLVGMKCLLWYTCILSKWDSWYIQVHSYNCYFSFKITSRIMALYIPPKTHQSPSVQNANLLVGKHHCSMVFKVLQFLFFLKKQSVFFNDGRSSVAPVICNWLLQLFEQSHQVSATFYRLCYIMGCKDCATFSKQLPREICRPI
jgi:hypothetical protein